MIEIAHSAGEGSLARGTARGDGSAPILKANGWRWSGSIGAWYQPQSRDREPRIQALENTRNQLIAAGLETQLEIDFARRTPDDVERDREDRAGQRADRLGKRAEAAARASTEADARSRQISAGIPLGQPILVGHHSESRHRRDLESIDRATRVAIDADQVARENERRAQLAASEGARRRDPLQVARRIANLEREERKLRRSISGYTNALGDIFKPASGAYRDRLERELQTATEQLAYWQRVRQAQVDAGQVTNYSRETIAKGDSVQYRGRWYEVVRANPKSVSVRSQVGGSWTDTLPYAELTGHRPAGI
jgi:hypothetical protein